MKKIAKTVLLFVFASSVTTHAWAETLAAPEIHLKNWQAQPDLSFEPAPGRLTLVLELDGPVVLNLEENHELLATAPKAAKTNRFFRNHQFFGGQIEGNSKSWTRLNLIYGQLNGVVFDGEELWLIDQPEAFGLVREKGIGQSGAISFRLSDLDFPGFYNHGDQLAGEDLTENSTSYQAFSSHLKALAADQPFPEKSMPITVVTDELFSAAYPEEELARVLGRINIADGLYSEQLDVGIRLWHYEMLDEQESAELDQLQSEAGEGSDASKLLEGFRIFMTQGSGSSIPFRGLAHLFSGRTMQPIGSAYRAANLDSFLCNPVFGYGVESKLNSPSVSALLFAHQVGHNFNAPHDQDPPQPPFLGCPDSLAPSDYGIMSEVISENTRAVFSSCSLYWMQLDLEKISGLENCLVETEFLFADDFEDGL